MGLFDQVLGRAGTPVGSGGGMSPERPRGSRRSGQDISRVATMPQRAPGGRERNSSVMSAPGKRIKCK
jgi:hypothetical protein